MWDLIDKRRSTNQGRILIPFPCIRSATIPKSEHTLRGGKGIHGLQIRTQMCYFQRRQFDKTSNTANIYFGPAILFIRGKLVYKLSIYKPKEVFARLFSVFFGVWRLEISTSIHQKETGLLSDNTANQWINMLLYKKLKCSLGIQMERAPRYNIRWKEKSQGQ